MESNELYALYARTFARVATGYQLIDDDFWEFDIRRGENVRRPTEAQVAIALAARHAKDGSLDFRTKANFDALIAKFVHGASE